LPAAHDQFQRLRRSSYTCHARSGEPVQAHMFRGINGLASSPADTYGMITPSTRP
jgi:hypothetical protein